MNTIELWVRNRRGCFSGPSDWSELTPRQAIGIMRVRMQSAGQVIPVVLFPALQLLYGLRPRHQRWLFDERFLRRRRMADPELILAQGQLLIDTVRWIGETDPPMAFLVTQFRRFDFRFGTPAVLLGRLRHRERYYAPGEGLGDATFEEFIMAYNAYRSGDLVQLAAVLYRPGAAGDRLALTEKSLARRRVSFARLDPALLALIGEQFESTLQYLKTCFRFVFPSNPTLTSQTTGEKSGNWLDVTIGMAKMDATKVGEIEQLNLYLALKVLNEQLRQAEGMEAQFEKIRAKH